MICELWHPEEYANMFLKAMSLKLKPDEIEARKEKMTQLATEWLADGVPIALETYIILAQP